MYYGHDRHRQNGNTTAKLNLNIRSGNELASEGNYAHGVISSLCFLFSHLDVYRQVMHTAVACFTQRLVRLTGKARTVMNTSMRMHAGYTILKKTGL